MTSVNLYSTLQDLNTVIIQHVKSYSLNIKQIMTIHYTQATRESVIVIQESSKIKKTFFQMISAMSLIVNLCHKSDFNHTSCHHQLMMITQINNMINQTAERLNNMICSHSEIFSVSLLMIHVHVMHTNQKIFMKNSVNRQDKSFDVKLTLYNESTINDDLLKIMSVYTLLTLYRTATHTSFNIRDSCLCLYDMSLEMIMLKICDLMNSLYTDSESIYTKLKNDLLYFKDDHLMSLNENEAMINQINQLHADTLRHVNVILCTLTVINNLTFYFYFSSHVIYVNKVNKAAENKI